MMTARRLTASAVFAVSCLVLASPARCNPAAKAVVASLDEVVDAAAKVSGRSLTPSVRTALAQQLRQAAVRHGDDVLRATQRGGLELAEAAARHGDDVWRFSAMSPGAARSLALHADDLLPAIRRVGPELLELEARHPAIALRATRAFGDDAVRYLAKEVPSSDLPRLVGFAERADSPATRKLLLEAYRRDGPVILRKLDWKVVLATGLSAAMITGAHQVSDGIQDSLTTLASDHPGKVPVAIGALTSPLRTLARTIAVVVGLGILWQFRSQLRRLRAWSVARSKAPPSAKGEQP